MNLLSKGITASILSLSLLPAYASATPESRTLLIQPVQAPVDLDQAQVELGKKLFFDPRLSKSGFISCNSCHNLSMGGTDNMPSSIGHEWQVGPINSPTVLNSSLNFVQFWDGRAKDLQEQAGGPIENPMEMGSSHQIAVAKIASMPGYVKEFKQTFNNDQISIEQVTSAIAEFEKTLVTENARFDLYLKGDDSALNTQELRGYQTFVAKGCVSCHSGEAIGGTMFQKMGIVKPYKTENTAIGRQGVTGLERDYKVFKVPTLRNIELTYPYFHDGAEWDLEQAVRTMADIQLGLTLTSEESKDITAFLKTLTGEQPNFALPQLPPSVTATPRPEY